MKKVNIGLDLGITSVGWAIADENLNLLDRGVRLFDALDDNGELANAKRREKRAARRQTSRRKNLKKYFIKLLVKHKLVATNYLDAKGRVAISLAEFGKTHSINSKDENLLKLRLDATKQDIGISKLIGVLYWYLSNRGFEYEVAGDEDYSKAQEEFREILENTKGKLVVEIQNEFFKENGFFKSSLNRNFSTVQYIKELDLILDKSSLSKEFKESYITLFKRRRNFESGPGPKSLETAKLMAKKEMHKGLFERSRFSINESNEVVEGSSVWEKTIGKCSLYPNEDRAPKSSFSAEIFNLLNDLNNITIRHHQFGGEAKLRKEHKIEIINLSLKTKANVNSAIKFIAKVFDVEDDEIYGFRQKVKKNNEVEYLLTELSSYHSIKKAFKHAALNFNELVFNGDFSVFDSLDMIIKPCYKFKEVGKRVNDLSDLDAFKGASIKSIEDFAKKIEVSSATHSLSFKALKEYASILLDSEDNYSKISYEERQKDNSLIINRKYIQAEWIEDLIASPTIKRGIRQAIKVLNSIIKHYPNYHVDNIVIEMARETNDKQAKANIKDLQATLADIRTQLRGYIGDPKNSASDFKPSKNIITKLWLYSQQKGFDPYDGKALPQPNEIMRNPNLVDIDHVIPYSQSFDDSRNNKVLTKKEHNSAKGNLSARQYVTQNFGTQKYDELFKLWTSMFITNENKAFNSQNKFRNMIDPVDYSNPANAFGFINRNLVDTRYIAREVLNHLQKFVKSVSAEHPWHDAGIKTINGKMTSFISKMVSDKAPLIRPYGFDNNRFDDKGIKNREWNGHHSEDAFLILHGALKNQKLNKFIEKTINNPFISQRDKEEFSKDMASKYNEDLDFEKRMDVDLIRQQLNDSINDVKFSYMLSTRNNRQFSNETFYSSVRDEEGQLHKVVKIKLQSADYKKLSEIFNDEFIENKGYKIPMKEFDLDTFKELEKMFESNADQKEPFAKFCDAKGRVKVNVGKNNTLRFISQITIIQESKNESEIIMTSSNGASFFESLEWIELRLYKNIQNKNKVIPVTAANHFIKNGMLIPKQDVLDKVFAEKQIDKNAEPWIILKQGTIISDPENNLYRVNGQSHSQDKIELKRLDGLNAKKQELYTLNTKLKGWNVCEIDPIGTIKKIAEF